MCLLDMLSVALEIYERERFTHPKKQLAKNPSAVGQSVGFVSALLSIRRQMARQEFVGSVRGLELGHGLHDGAVQRLEPRFL